MVFFFLACPSHRHPCPNSLRDRPVLFGSGSRFEGWSTGSCPRLKQPAKLITVWHHRSKPPADCNATSVIGPEVENVLHTSNARASNKGNAAMSGYRATSPRSMTGWVCDFQPQEAHPSSRRLASRIKQVMSAFPVDRFALSSLIGKLQVLFSFRSTRTDCQTVQRPCGGATPRQPRGDIVGNRGERYPHPFRQQGRMTSRVATAGLRSSLGLQNRALMFFRSGHEICAGRVPSAPVSTLVSRLADALRCSVGWAQ